MIKKLYLAVMASAFAAPIAMAETSAQTAEVGKTYEVAIVTESGDYFSGAFGDGRIGEVVVQITEAKPGEKYSVTVTGVRENGFTGLKQVSCTFQQIGGERDGRTGQCNPAPGS